MPVISVFFGIAITMYWREHGPPHFHAKYGEFEALINIQTLAVMRGALPKRALAMVLEWAVEHRVELLEDWRLCEAKAMPKPIQPLE